MATREFNFTVGPETSDQPAVGTPSADDDLITRGYADTRYLHGAASVKHLGDAAYTILDDDGYDIIAVGDSAVLTTGRTITLPTLADNNERRICVIKCDTSSNAVTVDGEGSEVVGPASATTFVLNYQEDAVWLVGDTTANRWVITAIGNINDASATKKGLVNTSAQSFAGVKTFNDGLNLDDAGGQSTLNYFKDWTDYTPTVTFDVTTATIGIQYSRYMQIGKQVTWIAEVSVSNFNGASGTDIFKTTVPVTRATGNPDMAVGHFNFYNSTDGKQYLGAGQWASTTQLAGFTSRSGDGTTAQLTNVTVTTYGGTGSEFRLAITYEAA